MVSKIHRMHLPKVGEGVVHTGGGVPGGPDTVQQYDLGALMRLGRKEFVYAKSAGLGVTNMDLGVRSTIEQYLGYTTVATDAVAGATEVVIDIEASAGFGTGDDGVFDEDELAGGEIVFFPHDENSFTRGITGNTATTGAGEMTLTLDSPIPVAIEDGVTHCEATPSPYLGVENTSNTHSSIMGMPTCKATAGQFLWLQVSGICWCAPSQDVGDTADERQVVFTNNGSLVLHAQGDNLQLAGTLVNNKPGAGRGAPFVFLQIAH